jgi:hypothetical protein
MLLPASRSRSRLAFPAAALLLAALAVGETGCGSRPKADAFDEAVAGGERPVAMKGDALFFDGRIAATVTISRGVGHGEHMSKKGGAFGGEERMDSDEINAYVRARGALGSPLPPVTLRLKLENKGAATVQVDILESNSDLGNFAVRPEVLSLAPGQSGEPDPMLSQLGVTSDDIPVKVTLKVNGKTESHAIAVKSVVMPPGSPPP